MLKVLLVVALITVAVWLLVRLIDQRVSRPSPRVVGPDDDPDFLRGLDRPGPDND